MSIMAMSDLGKFQLQIIPLYIEKSEKMVYPALTVFVILNFFFFNIAPKSNWITWIFAFVVPDKGCVRRCVENMQRAQDLSPLEMVEMFVTVFCFLKDSSEVSQTLLDDFKGCQGYNFLADFLLRYRVQTHILYMVPVDYCISS